MRRANNVSQSKNLLRKHKLRHEVVRRRADIDLEAIHVPDEQCKESKIFEKNRGLEFLFKISIPESPVGYEHSAHLPDFFYFKNLRSSAQAMSLTELLGSYAVEADDSTDWDTLPHLGECFTSFMYFVTNSCCLFAAAKSDEEGLSDPGSEDDWRCWSSAEDDESDYNAQEDDESDSDSDSCPDLGKYFLLLILFRN